MGCIRPGLHAAKGSTSVLPFWLYEKVSRSPDLGGIASVPDVCSLGWTCLPNGGDRLEDRTAEKRGFSAPRKDVQGSKAEGSKLRNVMILVQIH